MAEPDSSVQVAVVGAGRWGLNHVRTWQRLGNLGVVADSDPHRKAAIREVAPDVEIVDDLGAVIARGGVDAVILATPAITHAALTVEAVRAGLDVLVEKPMATRQEDAEAMVAAAADAGRILMVGHVLEYHPGFVALRDLVEDGALGRIQYVYSNRLNFGRLRTEENALWSFAPHDIALILRLARARPSQVAVTGGTYVTPSIPDVTLMSMTFPNGIDGHLFVSWLHPFKEQRFVVVGSRQMAVLDDTAPLDQKLVLYPHELGWERGQVPVARLAEGRPVAISDETPLDAECRHFAAAVADRTTPLTDGIAGLDVIRVLAAGERSLAASGAPTSLVERAPVIQGAFVHETAVIDPGAVLGDGCKVWHFSHVMEGARIGRDCALGQNVFVGRDVPVGDRTRVQNNVSVYEGVTLEDDVFCGPAMTFTNVVNPRADVERKQEFRPTLVRRGASLGANCTIVCGVTVGEHALVGAGAVVTSDVPAFALVAGVPARRIGWVSRRGRTLDIVDGRATCPEDGSTYRLDGDALVPD